MCIVHIDMGLHNQHHKLLNCSTRCLASSKTRGVSQVGKLRNTTRVRITKSMWEKCTERPKNGAEKQTGGNGSECFAKNNAHCPPATANSVLHRMLEKCLNPDV